jgi:hypothetical protein
MIFERKEAWMRIIVLIVSGIILSVWKTLIQIIVIVHWLYVIFGGKRSKDLAEFCNIWNTQVLKFLQYITFVHNDRPWPFSKLGKSIGKYK